MKGAPAKPMSGTVGGSSLRRMRIASVTNGTDSSGSNSPSASTPAELRTGLAITGPGAKSSSTPMPSSGVMMSLNRIAASSSKRRMGCIVTSAASSGVLVRVRKSTSRRSSRYSGR